MAKSYEELKQFIAKGRGYKIGSRTIKNNTEVIDRGDHIAVRLHRTDVVKVYPDGTYQLYAGGWHTVTTKQRINEFSPANVYQQDWCWYVNNNDTLFEEGIRVDSRGKVIDDRTILHLQEG